METGEPYIMFKDNVNNANPPAYKKNNLEVTMTNICSEITLFIQTKSIVLFVVYHLLILLNGMNGKTQI